MTDKEYTEREARYVDINKVTIPKGFFNEDLNVPKLLDWLDSQSIADVVEVVRCKECKYIDVVTCPITGTERLYCDFGTQPVYVKETHFCSYGVKREGIN